MRPAARWWAGGAALALVAGGALALGPGAAGLVDHAADGVRIWRLGTLSVDGVRGAWIGDLRAARVTLTDSEGVWAEAQDVRLSWRPTALFGGQAHVRGLDAATIAISRRPQLSAQRPPRRTGLSMRVDGFGADRIEIAEAAFGQAATARLSGALRTDRGALEALTIEAVRLDADGDIARIAAAPRDGVLAADIAIDGAAGGLIAAALGAEGAVAVRAQVAGDRTAGTGEARALVGDEEALRAGLEWTGTAWTLSARLQPSLTPGLPLVERLGGAATVEALGALGQGARGFEATLSAPSLAARVTGALGEDLRPAGPMAVTAESRAPGVLAPELPLESAGLRAEGSLTVARNGDWRFEGDSLVSGARLGELRADLSGPVQVQDGSDALRFDANWAVAARGALYEGAELAPTAAQLNGRFDWGDGRFVIADAAVSGRGFKVTARSDGDGYAGRAQTENLALVHQVFGGAASGDWTLTRAREDGPWRLTAEAQAQRFTFANGLESLFGGAPRATLEATVIDDGLDIAALRVTGPNVRGAARGRATADALDLRVEASARGPVRLGGMEIDGVADATGRVFGEPGNPSALIEAQLPRLDVAGVALTQATVRVAYADGAAATQVQAVYAGAPLEAQGDIRIGEDATGVSGLTARLGGLEAQGDLLVRAGALSGALAVSGVLDGVAGLGGRVEAQATLSGTPELPIVDASAEVNGAPLGDGVLEFARVRLQGPLSGAALQVAAASRFGREAARFEGAGGLQVTGAGMTLTIQGAGEAAGAQFETQGPVTYTQGPAGQSLIAGVRFAEGSAALSWQERRGGVTAEASLANAPLAPFAAIAGERAEGRLTGTARLASAQGRLTGAAEGTASGVRLRGRMSDPVNLTLSARLAEETLHADVTARSGQGLNAEASITAPVVTSAAPLRIAQDARGRGRARWRVDGPADAMWALTGLYDQDLDGQVQGAGEARFGPGEIAGEGTLRLTQGSFEDRLTGLQLQDVTGEVAFSDDLVRIVGLSARDRAGGRVTGAGEVRGARSGQVRLELDGLTFLDREDMSAAGDGQLTLAWTPETTTLSGALTLTEANVEAAPAAASEIVVIEVEEVNVPQRIEVGRPRTAGETPGAQLDLTIRAPGRVFTRYRGSSAEWALDLTARGTTRAPELLGEARLLRGQAELAQRPFVLTRGRISFRGPVEDAGLDIEAERETPDLTARITVSGTVGEPEITLTSDPALPEDEILPQILYGATQAELSGLQAAQLAASLSALAGGAAFDVADITRRAIGLDTFDLRDDGDGLAVVGGRYLTRDVFLEVARSSLGETRTRVEWRVRPQLTLVTSFAQSGEQRASIRWRRDY